MAARCPAGAQHSSGRWGGQIQYRRTGHERRRHREGSKWRGTLVKNIRLIGKPDEIACSTKQVRGLVLRTEFLKKP